MLYLIWRAQVKAFIKEKYGRDDWEYWVTWREYYLANKSAELAATEAHQVVTQSI
jgi:hypothetical protein